MKVKLFPDGRVHSAYFDLVNHPPDGVEYVGNFDHLYRTLNPSGNDIARYVLDSLRLPYVFNINTDGFDLIHCVSNSKREFEHSDQIPKWNLIHSCQKLIHTKSDFVIDIEHGNPFMGAYCIDKYKYLQFKYIVSKILSKDNCKAILPWSVKAMTAFTYNFSFLDKHILEDKLRVIYPAVEYIGIGKKFDKFTFIFIGGESFYAKGGLQVLEAFEFLKKNYTIDFDLIMIGTIPIDIKDKYSTYEMSKMGLWLFDPMQRGILLDTMKKCHCLLLPSHGDTFGITVLEAKAMGIPSIMANSFSASEIVSHEHTGYIISHDKNINSWFDIYGRKMMNKTTFHSQFKKYKPDSIHVLELIYSMLNMMEDNNAFRMGKRCLDEIDSGKFSLKARNSMLKEVYEK